MSTGHISAVAPLALALPTAIGTGGATLAAGLNPTLAALAYTGAGIGTFVLASAVAAAVGSRDHG